MKQINNYIIEKLHINKDTLVNQKHSFELPKKNDLLYIASIEDDGFGDNFVLRILDSSRSIRFIDLKDNILEVKYLNNKITYNVVINKNGYIQVDDGNMIFLSVTDFKNFLEDLINKSDFNEVIFNYFENIENIEKVNSIPDENDLKKVLKGINGKIK